MSRRLTHNPLTTFLGAVVSRLAKADGSQILDVSSIMDGEFLKRSGSNIVSAIPDGATGGAGTATYLMLPWPATTGGNAGVGSSNKTWVFRLFLPATITVNSVVWRIATGEAGKFISFGIYSIDGLTRHLDTGPVSCASNNTVGTKTLGSPVTLTPGMYWLAWTSDSISMSFNAIGYGVNAAAIRENGTFQYGHGSNASSAGQLPATLGSITSDVFVQDSIPIVKLQN